VVADVGAKLSHVFLLTRDLAAMRRLLVDAIGLEILVEDADYLRIGGGGGFHLGIEEGDPGPPNATEFVIEVDDLDETYRRASAAGVAFDGPPAMTEWGARQVWLTDHDGRRISITESAT
jgi:catechol 2,3-dioxygenase-like lactoylglutathione lyase family enzyme